MHELVLPYRLGEIRLQSEHDVQKPGLTASADLLVQISREEVATAVTCDEDADYRHFPWFWSAWASRTPALLQTVASSRELPRREHRGLQQFVVLVDEKFRRTTHDLTTEDRLRYPNFSAGLQAALKDPDHILAESRLEVLNSPLRHVQASAPTSKTTRTRDKPNPGRGPEPRQPELNEKSRCAKS